MRRRVLPPVLACCLLLAACSDSHDVMEDLPNSSLAGAPREEMPETRIEGTLSRPVTIGEDGPRLDACGAIGVVRGPGQGGMLDLRAAPFAEAKRIAALPAGARVHVCTRSIDQRWLGVVVEPVPTAAEDQGANAAAPASLDCGVSSPVEAKRAYAGPCASGWVSSAFVQMVGG